MKKVFYITPAELCGEGDLLSKLPGALQIA